MGVSTIAKVINETCLVLWDELQPTEMAPPTVENWLEIAEGFYKKTQFPNCVGAVGGKHIWLQCPKIVVLSITTIRIFFFGLNGNL